MKAEPNELQRAILPTTEAGVPRLKDVVISRRSRVITWFLRQIMPRYLRWMLNGSNKRIARAQLLVASQTCKDSSGFAIDYDVIGAPDGRSEERRVGKECVSTCSSRWSPDPYTKKYINPPVQKRTK